METNQCDFDREIEEVIARAQKMRTRQKSIRTVSVLFTVLVSFTLVYLLASRNKSSNQPISPIVEPPKLVAATTTPTLIPTASMTATVTFTPSSTPTPIPNISGTWIIFQQAEHVYNMNPKKVRCGSFVSTYHTIEQKLELIQLPDSSVEGRKLANSMEPSVVEGDISGMDFTLRFIDYSVGSTAIEECRGTLNETKIEASCDYVKLPSGYFCFISGSFTGTLEGKCILSNF